ncbi:hypothetical protein SAMN05880501_10936 [Ureibacillus xyleni]|uniref:Uncharacterized protein n=1 Tax=Ureibacillus xyleni TaxID=614648 RepID=A0A285T6E5_9BACL|nr:hypothetical protein [Ureibacillus xyleni]SOC16594.1 hypothetical protein SAMN05880501_10936 [Ureibacillus xyleni]
MILRTLTEAELAFETYFTYGSKYNGTFTQITGSRNPSISTSLQRMGMQLQFLGALYPRTTDANRKQRVIKEINLILSILNISGLLNKSKLTYGNVFGDPGYGMILLGFALIKKSSTYNALNLTSKGIVDTNAKNFFDYLGAHLFQFCIKEVNTDTAPYKYGGLYAVPKFALNSPALVAGALGVYSDLVSKSSPHRSAIVTFSNTVVGRYGYSNNSRTFIPIGGKNTVRKPFGSSGYNAYTGMGLALAAHGHTGTRDLKKPSNGGNYLTQAKQIAAYYTSVLNSGQAHQLHEPFDFAGAASTITSINTVKARLVAENTGTSPSLVTSDASVSSATELLNHKQPSAYLYNLTWLGDTTFLAALDKRVVASGEAKSLVGVSAMRACMNVMTPAEKNTAAANRILSGFAGLLERGITTITDGK